MQTNLLCTLVALALLSTTSTAAVSHGARSTTPATLAARTESPFPFSYGTFKFEYDPSSWATSSSISYPSSTSTTSVPTTSSSSTTTLNMDVYNTAVISYGGTTVTTVATWEVEGLKATTSKTHSGTKTGLYLFTVDATVTVTATPTSTSKKSGSGAGGVRNSIGVGLCIGMAAMLGYWAQL